MEELNQKQYLYWFVYPYISRQEKQSLVYTWDRAISAAPPPGTR